MPGLEILKFRKGRFTLEDVSSPAMRLQLSKDARWKELGDDAYETRSLGAVVKFRGAADPKTAKILKRVFQEHYLPPKCETRFPGLLDRLDPHQKDGLLWALTRKRSYLAHAPGAGKTAVAILAAVLAPGDGPALFIVPPFLTVNWEREILKFTDWCDLWPSIGIVGRSSGQDDVAWRADFIICPDSMITRDWVQKELVARPWKVIAVDEASRFKDYVSQRSLAFYGGRSGDRSYPGVFRKARHVVFLDGSPMPTRAMDIWAPTYALHPEAIDCRDLDDFGYRYCGARPNEYGQWEYKYSSHETELQEKLQKDFMHVVTEDRLSHPERRRRIVVMNEDVRGGTHKEWERRNLSAINFDAVDEKTSRGSLAIFRRELGVKKVPWVARYVRDRLKNSDESILLFAWHREVVVDLCRHIGPKWKPAIVYGGTSKANREKVFRDFQKGTRRLLVMNIASGGRGHNLQRADRIIFAEWSWSDEYNRQCEKRASRRGNVRKFVRCEYLACPNSMDEVVLRSVFRKAYMVEKVIG